MIRKDLEAAFAKLSEWIAQHNREAGEEGEGRFSKQEIRIAGQMALLLADLPFPIISTMDLDLAGPLPSSIRSQLASLLLDYGIRLEAESAYSMPEETKYLPLFDFPWVKVMIADPDSVIVAKSGLSRAKDQKLFETYQEYFPRIMARLK